LAGQEIHADRDAYIAGRDVRISSPHLTVHFDRPPDEDARTSALLSRVPRQIPFDTPDFTGRADDVARLDELRAKRRARSPNAIVISALDGTAGAGKTTLAVHWAHRVRREFEDGDLFINLRGFDFERPVEPAEALDYFLRALGVPPKHIPRTLQEKSALYRTVMDNREMLVVLDNAATSEQVRPLIPGADKTFVLVTSRNRLSGLVAREAATRITIGLLSKSESLDLLERIVGRERLAAEPEPSQELVRLTAGLPLAIRIVGERIASRRTASLATFVEALHDENERLDYLATHDDETTAVRAVFDWSYHALGSEDASAFRLLGLHAGAEVSLHAARSLLSLSSTASTQTLSRLASVHLIEEVAVDRYSFHDLLRVYAKDKLAKIESGGSQRAAVERCLLYYLYTANAANTLIMPQRQRVNTVESEQPIEITQISTYEDALAWCDRERENISIGIQQAYDYDLHHIAWQTAVVMRGYFNLRKHWNEWISTHSVALKAAQAASDRYGEGRILNGLGTAYKQIGAVSESLSLHRKALALRERIGDLRGTASALDSLGNAYRAAGRTPDSVACYERSLAIRIKIGDSHGQAWSLNNLGEARSDTGDLAAAKELFMSALPLRRHVGDRWGEGLTLHNMGVACSLRHESSAAHGWLKAALNVRQEIGDRWGSARTYFALGRILHDEGDSVGARELLQHALILFEDLDDPQADEVRYLLSHCRR
jgi:tetratricopeptide (TPR) repeat protein